MGRNAFFQLSKETHLSKTWMAMYNASTARKRDGYGIDGVSLNKFKSNHAPHIHDISRALREGIYRPRPLVPHFIPKANGKDRLICVPTVSDRLVQRAVLALLDDYGYRFENGISYGFVKGRSVTQAAQRAVALRNNHRYAYKADISAFFDEVPRELLIERVRKKIRLKSLHPLIESMIGTEVNCPHEGAQRRIAKLGIKRGKGLRQGMPISPYLANLMLANFDREVEKRGIRMVRYADDLIAFADSWDECRSIHEFCTEHITRDGLTIHPLGDGNKTVIAEPNEVVEFLGLGLSPKGNGYHLKVTAAQMTAIKQKILGFSDLDYCLKNGVTLSVLLRKLDAKICGYLGVYELCANFNQLDQTLNSAKAIALRDLFTNHFGIKYETLTNRGRKFLEVEYE